MTEPRRADPRHADLHPNWTRRRFVGTAAAAVTATALGWRSTAASGQALARGHHKSPAPTSTAPTSPSPSPTTSTTSVSASPTVSATASPTSSASGAPQPGGFSVGFNETQGSGYTQSSSQIETCQQSVARLTATFGSFRWGKCFYNGGKQLATFDPAMEGLLAGVMLCWSPDPAMLASGGYDSQIRAYCASVPTGHRVMLAPWNEADNGWTAGTPDQLRAARDHLFDVVHGCRTGGGVVEVWDCWMGYSVFGSKAWQDSWTNPAKRDGIGWDTYWNQSWISVDPHSRLDQLATVAARLRLPWAIPETGDNRPGTGNEVGTSYDDATRASRWTARINAMRADGAAWVSYFDQVGTTGDHRILLPSDSLTRQALAAQL